MTPGEPNGLRIHALSGLCSGREPLKTEGIYTELNTI